MASRFIEADGYDVVFELIQAGRVEAGVVNRLFGLQNKARYLVKETPIIFNPIEVRFAAPKMASSDVLSAIDVHLRRMHYEKDPFYTQTLNKWLVAPSEWALPDWVRYTLIGVGVILILLAAMSLTLRNQVNRRTKELSSANTKLQAEIVNRQQAEEELRKYERIVAKGSTDHMMIIGPDYTYQAINDSALRAIDKSREEVIGKKTWEVLGEILNRKLHMRRLARVFAGQTVKYRAWMNFPGSGNRYMDMVYTPYRGPNGDILGCVVNSRDITDRHELELKLENAQKMEFMGTIAGGVAHDLNNILSGIVSYPELLLMDLPEESPLVEPIELIRKSGEKAAVIVQDLLTLARRGVATMLPVDLNEIITALLGSPECDKILSFHPQVSIETVLTDDPTAIIGSSVHLSKTVMNLISNAAEAMPEGGRITIRTTNTSIDDNTRDHEDIPPGDYVLLEVADQGAGIVPEYLERIFEPFYTKKVMGRSGTGLGLAVVWGTVMDHHGYIMVKSDVQHGSTFRLFFPVTHDARQAPTTAIDLAQYRGNGERILIVDDVPEQREIASKILSQIGYRVDTVKSGEDAIEHLRQHPADLVVLDMLMPPGMDGLQTFEAILKFRPEQKAVIASGFAETDRVKAALDLGVGQFIKKPYSIVDMGLAIKAELNRL